MEKRSRRLSLNLINGPKINIKTLQINASFWNSRLFLEASTLILGRTREFIPPTGGGGVVDGTPPQSF